MSFTQDSKDIDKLFNCICRVPIEYYNSHFQNLAKLFLQQPTFTCLTLSFLKPNSYSTIKCYNKHSICIRAVTVGQNVKNLPHHTMEMRVPVFVKATWI